jgi:hypothetical protein
MPRKRMPNALLEDNFMDDMHENMWQFMNPDMIEHMFPIKTHVTRNMEAEKFKYHGTHLTFSN